MARKSSTPPIVVIGSSNTDMIVRVPRIPGPGETLLGGEFSTAAGGKGANQAVAAARAGGRVAFVARLGRDSLGDQALAGFVREGIEVGQISRDPAKPSGVALIFVAASGENSIAVAGGSNETLAPDQIADSRKVIAGAKVLLMQLETPLPTIEAAAAIASEAGVRVILNPAPAQPLSDSLLRKLSLLTPNEHEASLLSGVKVTNVASARKAARVLRAKGTTSVIITLGAKGAFVSTKGCEVLVPGFRMKAVDTTAAGDVFNGALAVRLSEGAELLDAVRFANAAAAISVTRPGAQPSIPLRAEIEALLSS
ncbi:MAG: ribokinase [Opitutaceae bacterium]|jgi:ribokinase